MSHDSPYNPPDEPRYGFGLTEVKKLQVILSRIEEREVGLEEAWGRAAELLAFVHGLLDAMANAELKDDL